MKIPGSVNWLHAAVAAAAGVALGWGVSMALAAAPSSRVDASAVAATDGTASELIKVGADGLLTARVTARPVNEVLDEIDRQAGLLTAGRGRPSDPPGQAPAAGPVPATAARDAAVPGTVRARILRGTEPERYDGLMAAESGGEGVSESDLQTLWQTDASPRVRLLAFDYAMQAHDGDAAGLRTALEAARLMPDPAIAGEANRRLAALPDQRGPDEQLQLTARR